MYLFFDTETTGLTKDYKAPVSNVDNWPRLVQLAFLLYSTSGELIKEGNYIIKPKDFEIPEESTKVHGITIEKATKEGEEIVVVLNEFYNMIYSATHIVAHNMSFDEKIIGAEFIRNGFNNILDNKTKICTMLKSVDYCKIPGKYGFKWPKLQELHLKLFDIDFKEAHNALVDIKATARCFWEMKKLDII